MCNPESIRDLIKDFDGGDGGGLVPVLVLGLFSIVIIVSVIFLAIYSVITVVWYILWIIGAFYIDWWFVLPVVLIFPIYRSIFITRNDSHYAISIVLLVIFSVPIWFGISGDSAVWSGIGFTRGADQWVAPWHDGFLSTMPDNDLDN